MSECQHRRRPPRSHEDVSPRHARLVPQCCRDLVAVFVDCCCVDVADAGGDRGAHLRVCGLRDSRCDRCDWLLSSATAVAAQAPQRACWWWAPSVQQAPALTAALSGSPPALKVPRPTRGSSTPPASARVGCIAAVRRAAAPLRCSASVCGGAKCAAAPAAPVKPRRLAACSLVRG